MATKMPALYLTHGGGPMPLLNHPSHKSLIAFFKSVRLPTPKALLVISGHWEERFPTVSSGESPEIIYDYFGFPEESYHFKYPAPGLPELAHKAAGLIRNAGFAPKEDPNRGYDHGTFVPLMLLFPKADIPVVQVSLLSSMNAQEHIKLGEALAPLREEGIMIIGSGSSYHNMGSLMSGMGGGSARVNGKDFDDFLQDSLANPAFSAEKRKQLLSDWAKAPGARNAHPREEHLLPLMVVLGAANCQQGNIVWEDSLFGARMSSYQFN